MKKRTSKANRQSTYFETIGMDSHEILFICPKSGVVGPVLCTAFKTHHIVFVPGLESIRTKKMKISSTLLNPLAANV